MKIALLHLDVAEGPETRNGRTIISAAGGAVSRGADWIVLPFLVSGPSATSR